MVPGVTDGLLAGDNSSSSSWNSSSRNGTGGDSYYYEDYEYDYEESLQTFNWPELLPALVVYGLTMVLGIVGNALIIFTIGRYRRMKSTTNVFLVSLACADLLLILICIPVKLAKLFSFTWTMGEFLCKSVHYMQNVSAICSVLTLTAMSIERYYAIVHPMKAKYMCTISQARKIIMCIWVAAFLLAVPMLFAQVHMEVGVRVKGYWCVKYWDNLPLWRFHEVYMLLLILVVPTAVMAIAYTSICWEIWSVMQQRCDMTTGQGFLKNGNATEESFPLKNTKKMLKKATHDHNSFKESMKKNAQKAEEESKTVKQVIKMLVAVVVLFVICWGPVLIDNVLTAYGVVYHIKHGSLKHMSTAFHLMSYFNSCVNPIVYGFMSKNFRDSFQKALCACCVRRRPLQRNGTLSHTRTTSVRFGPSAPSGSVSMAQSQY